MMLTYGQAMFCPTGENKKTQVFMTWIYCGEARKRCVSVGKNAKKVANNGNKNYFFLFFICLTRTTPNKITDIKKRGPAQT